MTEPGDKSPEARFRTFLDDVVRTARTGRTDQNPIVVVHGPPASGKSRLLATYHEIIGELIDPTYLFALDWSELRRRSQHRTIPAPRAQGPAPVLVELERIVSEALEKDPGARWQAGSHDHFRRRSVEAVESGDSLRINMVEPRPPVAVNRLPELMANNPTLTSIATALLVGAVHITRKPQLERIEAERRRARYEAAYHPQKVFAGLFADALNATSNSVGMLVVSLDAVDVHDESIAAIHATMQRTGSKILWLVSSRSEPDSPLIRSLVGDVSSRILTVRLEAKAARSTPSHGAPVSADIARRRLRDLDPEDADAVLALGLAYGSAHPGTVAAVLNLDRTSDLVRSLDLLHERYGFVLPDRPWLDEELRSSLRFLALDEESRRIGLSERNERACRHLRSRMNELVRPVETVEQQVAHTEWMSCFEELLWHTMWRDQGTGTALLQDALPALWVAGTQDTARRLLNLVSDTFSTILTEASAGTLRRAIELDDLMRPADPGAAVGPRCDSRVVEIGLRHHYRSGVLSATPSRETLVDVLECLHPAVSGLGADTRRRQAHRILRTIVSSATPRMRAALQRLVDEPPGQA